MKVVPAANRGEFYDLKNKISYEGAWHFSGDEGKLTRPPHGTKRVNMQIGVVINRSRCANSIDRALSMSLRDSITSLMSEISYLLILILNDIIIINNNNNNICNLGIPIVMIKLESQGFPCKITRINVSLRLYFN